MNKKTDATEPTEVDSTISRRGFIAAGVASAALIGAGGAGKALASQTNATYLRPPGAETEEDFLSRCNRCQRCVMVCPYSIIQPLSLSKNFLSQNTPIMNFKTGYCDYCNKCMEACPTGALRLDLPTSNNLGVAKVVKDVCIAWEWSGCIKCHEVCPVEGAITLDDHNRPVIHEDLCNGCGLCEHECPAASLRSYSASALPRGIFVVPRDSQVAHIPGSVTSDQFNEGREVKAKEA